ncbi:DUF2252 domain-containing protein [Lactobacillus hamsteri]|uniref:DUF2252 domain-containing protein n=1 Tax=Lactobacillus hamsteri DSM 5661 = JCM 6256 TaxID=1423754 RepID=A0A0R1YDQ8_9LACO|nr:DUF2252 domain-containing protein [Lactobacillus hamsteri]KRM37638.1 hypothetical protein FC39_GL000097 [Lactobacillus hamsteri DSM 5661 = JCM 6256]
MNKSFALKKFKIDKLRLKASKNDLISAGEKQADEISVSDLGTYKPVKRDIVQMVKAEEDNMIPELLPMRHERMMKNAFTFFRGTAGVMEYDLHHGMQSDIPVMICGDAHLNNFGFFASPERQLLFGLNDFDETGVGHWESDLKRLLVSVQLIGELNGYDEDESNKILSKTAKAYEDGINYANDLSLTDRFYLSYNIDDLLKYVSDDDQMVKVLKKISDRALKNNSDKVVKKFTTEEDGKIVFIENPPRARRVPKETYDDLLKAFDEYRENVSTDIQVFLSNFKVSDIIRYSVGVGSFGTRCYLALLTGKDDSHLVLQIKEALPSKYDLINLSSDEAIKQGYEEGRRVIAGQSILQTFYDPFLGYTKTASRSYYVRQFRDMKDSIDATKLDKESFAAYSTLCAFILAVAHYQSPTAPMIYGYLNKSKKFSKNMAIWAEDYSKQVHQDFDDFAKYLRGE